MELSILLAKITGVVLFIWTAYSIYHHIQDKQAEAKNAKPGVAQQSVSEQILNNILLYLWLAFMVVFSIGMVLNNSMKDF